jgi:hypothetical protein
VSHEDDPDSEGIRYGWSEREWLETNGRGVRITNFLSHYEIPWAAVRDVNIVEAKWRNDGSPYWHELRFTLATDANPGGPNAVTPDDGGPHTVGPGRFELVRARATRMSTANLISFKPDQPELNRLEELRHAILAARDAALASHSNERDAVEVRGPARILWNRPCTMPALERIGFIVLVLVITIRIRATVRGRGGNPGDDFCAAIVPALVG